MNFYTGGGKRAQQLCVVNFKVKRRSLRWCWRLPLTRNVDSGIFTLEMLVPTTVFTGVVVFTSLLTFQCVVDINILDSSDFITKLITQGNVYDSFEFEVNGQIFTQLYSLVDGIYPPYRCFMGTMSKPTSPAWKYYAKRQEGERKSVECSFGILGGKFRIIKNKSRMWYQEDMLIVIKVNLNMEESSPTLIIK